MRRIIIQGLLACLLALFPGLMPAQTLTSYEYWFDDNIAMLQSGSLSGTTDVIDANIDTRQLSEGIHKISIRVKQSDGMYSAITSSVFMKKILGVGSRLEYWIDGDRSTARVIDGKLASDGKDYIFNDTLDLADVTPGYHRLYYRAVSSTDLTASAVSMTPIIVKSRYYHDPNEPVTVDQYAITIDNGEMMMYDVVNPRDTITQTHYFDAGQLSPGNHMVKATFWNSLDASVSVEQAFNVTVPEEPSITLTAQQEGGLVKLHFNSIPKDKGYRLYRTLSTGTPNIVDHMTGSVYPSDVEYNDNPAAGTYKYQAWIPYTDRDGSSKVLKSNEVSVTVTKALSEEEASAQYGTITGRIVCDKNTPTSGLMVRFSNDDKTVPVQGTLFTRNKMLQGTEVTLTVEGDETHEYEPVTLTVGEGTTDVTINGTLIEENQPNYEVYDLILDSDLEVTSDLEGIHLKFKVKNRSLSHRWSGIVRVKAINKKKAGNMGVDVDDMRYGTSNMYTSTEAHLGFGINTSTDAEVTLQIKEKKETEYYLYFESIGKWDDEGQDKEYKPIAANTHYNVKMNPVLWPIPKAEENYQKWDKEAKEDFAYLALALSSVTPGMNGQVGDLEPFKDKMLEVTGKTSAKEAASVILDWIGEKSALEAINDLNLRNVTSAIKDIVIDIHDAVKPSLVERYWSNIIGAASEAYTAETMIDEFLDLYTIATSKEPFEQTMACSSLLLQAIGTGADPLPLASVMYTYSAVGKALVDAANNFFPIVDSRYIVHRLKHNKKYDGNSPERKNTAVDFKIIVKEAGWLYDKTINFTEGKMFQQIESVYIKVANKKDGTPAIFTFNLVPMDDGVMLETDEKEVPDRAVESLNDVAVFYMEIHWRNGRITYIPLNKSGEGLSISHDGVIPQDTSEDFSNKEPIVYTVTLITESGKDNMANEIYLGKKQGK